MTASKPVLWQIRISHYSEKARWALAHKGVEHELRAPPPGSLPGMLDRVDDWIRGGVLNGEEKNAADFMIAPSLALLCYRRDLRAQVEGRPAAELMERVLPERSAQPVAAAAGTA